MRNIMVYHKLFFGLSETFIYRQVHAVESCFNVVLVAKDFQNENQFKLDRASRYKISTTGVVDKLLTAFVRRILRRKLMLSIVTTFYVESVIKKNNIAVIHAHYGWSGLRILALAKKNRVPLVISFHGKDASEALKLKGYRERLAALFEYASGIIICSRHMIRLLPLEQWLPKVHLIPYGVDPNEFQPVPNAHSDTIKILHAGRLAPKKGVPDLIKVFADLTKRYRDIELHILGGGEELDMCKQLVVEREISEKVIFYGPRPQEVVKRLMNEVDIFVLNSRTDDDGDMEGLPNSLLEAMSLEKAVVSTYHAAIPDVVTDGYDGLLVNEKKNSELFVAIETFINDRPMRDQFGQRARQTVIEKFSLQVMEEKLCKLFDSISLSA